MSPGERVEVVLDLEPGEEVELKATPFPDKLDVPDDEGTTDFGLKDAYTLLTITGPAEDAPMLGEQAFAVDGIGTRLNYGLNRVRFPAPVPSGGRIRAVFRLKSVEQQGEGRYLVVTEATVELEGGSRPVCVAEMLVLYLV